ncbi:MAG TPA: hypothetical protein VNS09_24015 [Solirubrobacter sp.]|nr:hypothetical protein [Solirubrobacter sp.]
MVLRPRTRLQLRRAVVAAALGALFVPAAADAKAKTPTITKVAPRSASVGMKITLTGKNFKRGKGKNSVLFKRDKGKALFVKADVSTTRKLVVVVPKKLEKYMLSKGSVPLPTRFRLRVLASKLTKRYTSNKLSPVIGPEKANSSGNSGGAGVVPPADGDCDGDGIKNGQDPDDDNDLLPDALELALGLDPCSSDTDGDGVEDGFEYQSAIDLNNDNYQSPNRSLPYPGKTPYPNPLFKDADRDYDGDGLPLGEEYKLWKYTYEVNHTATRTLAPLSYSDGLQYSLSAPESATSDRRVPTQSVATYVPPQQFRVWADQTGFGHPWLAFISDTRDLYDMDMDGNVTTTPQYGQYRAEATYWDLDGDGWVSDDERDEDADGLTNYDEVVGPMTAGWWAACYSDEGEYPIPYAGTKAYDADSDGDGVLDGADDQDFDGIPNIMELSRNMAGGVAVNAPCGGTGPYNPPPLKALVNPFNPCLPDPSSRTCQRHPVIGAGYAPFKDHWEPLIRN